MDAEVAGNLRLLFTKNRGLRASKQKNNYLTSRNVEPTNLDLFLDLDSVIFHEEAKQDVKIGFWHVPREYNKIADRLAKRAARLGEPACLPMEADFC